MLGCRAAIGCRHALKHVSGFSQLQRNALPGRCVYRQYAQHVPTACTTTCSDKRLVVLIGWLGAIPKHFDKYLKLWEGMGHPTVSTMPTTRSIVLPTLGDKAATDFLGEVHAAQLQHSNLPVVYHIFSNAGFIFLGTMLRMLALQDPSMSSRVFTKVPQSPSGSAAPLDMLNTTSGIIIDSAPSRLTPDIAARGLAAAALGEPAEGVEGRHPLVTDAARLGLKPILGLPPIRHRIHEVWNAWDVVAPVRPQLYLYSSSDALIPPAEVELFMKQQKVRGVEICYKDFEDSPHCEHLRRHPQEYVKQLQQFLEVTKSKL